MAESECGLSVCSGLGTLTHTSIEAISLLPLFLVGNGDHHDLHLSIRRQRQMGIRDRAARAPELRMGRQWQQRIGTDVAETGRSQTKQRMALLDHQIGRHGAQRKRTKLGVAWMIRR